MTWVALFTGAWIETTIFNQTSNARCLSRSSRARGLKPHRWAAEIVATQVALFTGAWIETCFLLVFHYHRLVSSRSSRARGLKRSTCWCDWEVISSRSSRARGLKRHKKNRVIHRKLSRSSRARGLKQVMVVTLIAYC